MSLWLHCFGFLLCGFYLCLNHWKMGVCFVYSFFFGFHVWVWAVRRIFVEFICLLFDWNKLMKYIFSMRMRTKKKCDVLNECPWLIVIQMNCHHFITRTHTHIYWTQVSNSILLKVPLHCFIFCVWAYENKLFRAN